MSGIPLHPTRALDPHLTFCPRCGGEGRGLTLGHLKKVYQRGTGNLVGYCMAGQLRQFCAANKVDVNAYTTEELKEGEKVPDIEPCAACQAELAAFKAEVDNGGIYFKCKCGATGIIKGEHQLAKDVREHMKIPQGPCGVELDDCPQCRKGEPG